LIGFPGAGVQIAVISSISEFTRINLQTLGGSNPPFFREYNRDGL
jgi:hypothetical protein